MLLAVYLVGFLVTGCYVAHDAWMHPIRPERFGIPPSEIDEFRAGMAIGMLGSCALWPLSWVVHFWFRWRRSLSK
ncbi:hypothetical protein LCGC14_0798560 [marine sediment metagenome]|uniref:Uncharacterized protein n=1 Tax=marine sediment metagenome TaxID=412755 RepID=A0A0F9SXG2_9ZZZZ